MNSHSTNAPQRTGVCAEQLLGRHQGDVESCHQRCGWGLALYIQILCSIFIGLQAQNKMEGRAVFRIQLAGPRGGMKWFRCSVWGLWYSSAVNNGPETAVFYFRLGCGDPHWQEQVACGCEVVAGWCHTVEHYLKRSQPARTIWLPGASGDTQ